MLWVLDIYISINLANIFAVEVEKNRKNVLSELLIFSRTSKNKIGIDFRS